MGKVDLSIIKSVHPYFMFFFGGERCQSRHNKHCNFLLQNIAIMVIFIFHFFNFGFDGHIFLSSFFG